jgi:hypothetical protein
MPKMATVSEPSDSTQGQSERPYSAAESARALAAVREACLGLPEVSERPSHGSPAFFIRDKVTFVMFLDNHHSDGRLAIWCAAPAGVQVEMLETERARFFRPPYVGHRGWLGVHLLEVDQAELNAIVLEAYKTAAPKKLLARLDR